MKEAEGRRLKTIEAAGTTTAEMMLTVEYDVDRRLNQTVENEGHEFSLSSRSEWHGASE